MVDVESRIYIIPKTALLAEVLADLFISQSDI